MRNRKFWTPLKASREVCCLQVNLVLVGCCGSRSVAGDGVSCSPVGPKIGAEWGKGGDYIHNLHCLSIIGQGLPSKMRRIK